MHVRDVDTSFPLFSVSQGIAKIGWSRTWWQYGVVVAFLYNTIHGRVLYNFTFCAYSCILEEYHWVGLLFKYTLRHSDECETIYVSILLNFEFILSHSGREKSGWYLVAWGKCSHTHTLQLWRVRVTEHWLPPVQRWTSSKMYANN